ncbi:MAG: type II toxin-antitoxin system RelE/ParE family toxin [bacterium]|jgi:mRNA interferase RelE/StbE
MSYLLVVDNRARKKLEALPDDLLKRVDKKILALGDEPRPAGCIKLAARDGPGYRIRVGDIRILYDVNDKEKIVRVFKIERREKAYKKR